MFRKRRNEALNNTGLSKVGSLDRKTQGETKWD